jgi:hypothetical protein
MRVESRICRWLASVAWALSFGWFWLATLASWGFTPNALLAWTFLALPLAWVTVRWLRQSGREPSRRLIRIAGFTWLMLCATAILIGYFADNPFWDGIDVQAFFLPIVLVYALFPLIVTCMAIVLAWRHSRRLRAVE